MSIVDRISELSKQKGTTVSGIEKEVGLSNGIIGKWKKQSPSCENLKLVADHLNTTIDYLVTGEKKNTDLTETESELINDFRSLNEKGKLYVQSQVSLAKEVYKK